MNYKKIDLKKMSLKALRAMDIRSPEDESLVQEVIDEKLLETPNQVELKIPASFTDNLTPEKELALQAKIDSKLKDLAPKAKKADKKESVK